MLRGNLSSRPFYNEGLASSVIAVVAILAVALSAFSFAEAGNSMQLI